MIGRTLGPYQVVAKLGEGGMGEVYRATDTNLKRDVAVKVLPESVAGDAERLTRFQREAEVLASLNHPNIAQIYGLERAGGTTALVMELVEGPTLAERTGAGPVPVDEALAIARQIAEALEAAHERGIVHRDLKPANIKVRPDGTVKVLDFGLAKAMETGDGSGAAAGSPSQSPTMTSPAMTAMGMILGTAAYMSPEQARGKAVDARADAWAFGCVLYEMVTGRPAFEDEDVSLTLSKVLQRDPDFDVFPADVPPHIRQIVRLCLRKSLSDRLTDVGAIRLALSGAFDSPDVRAVGATVATRRRQAATLVGALVAMAVAGTLLGRFVFAPASPPPPPFEFDVSVAGYPLEIGSFALSPEGVRLALVVRDASGQRQLAVREMAASDSRVLPGTQGALFPFWSPDGREIGYFTDRQLFRVALDGGVPRPIAAVTDARGGAWTTDDLILVGNSNGPIHTVSASGGRLEPLTTLDPGVEDGHVWPALLPDNRRYVFLADAPTDEGHRLYLGDLNGGPSRVLKQVIRSQPIVDPSGAILLGELGQLVAYSFDFAAGTMGDRPTLIETQVFAVSQDHALPVSASVGGMVAFQKASPVSHLVIVDSVGRVVQTIGDTAIYGNPSVSPDGRQVAFEVYTYDETLVWVHDLERGVRTPLSVRGAKADSAAWSPDGQFVYFDSDVGATWETYRRSITGGGEPERVGLPEGAMEVAVLDVSSDGRWLLSSSLFPGSRDDLYLYALDGSGTWTSWLSSPAQDYAGMFSPDSKWIAYASDASGRSEVYVAPVEGGPERGRWPISSQGGFEPRFSPDGRTLYYRSFTFDWMAVDVTFENGAVQASPPRVLFAIPPMELPYMRNLVDVFPDGSRFLTVRPVETSVQSIRVRTQR